MTTKLSSGNSNNRQLQQKLANLSKRLDGRDEANKTQQKDSKERQKWRERKSNSESQSSSLISDVEELTQRVLQIEGKDEELLKMEKQCEDLTKRLEIECTQSNSLRAEVDALNCRIMELEKFEDAFNKIKLECCLFKSSLEKERSLSKNLSNELDSLKTRIKELEAVECQLEKADFSLKEELSKLKALTVIMVDERKTMIAKMRRMEEKFQKDLGKLQAEQDTDVSEKHIEESKVAFKSKAELEEKMQRALRDRDELRVKLKAEEERSNELKSKVNIMKRRLQSLEVMEREFLRNKSKEENIKATSNHCPQKDNKVQDLTQEVQRLKQKLKDMMSVEDDLLKTKDEFESLQKRYFSEQERAKLLLQDLAISRKEISKYHLAEKKEFNQEHILYKLLKDEETKSSNLARQLEALKEKLQNLMGTEESICHLKKDHSILQRKLTREEGKNKQLARELGELTEELERYQQFSKSYLPGQNRSNLPDLKDSSKEVQADAEIQVELATRNKIPCAVGDLEDDLNYNNKFPYEMKCRGSLVNNITNLNQNIRISVPKFNESQNTALNSKLLKDGNHVLTHSPGQPLHIKVTPDHEQNTAMLEITSPTTENTHSYTSTAIIPTNSNSPKQKITIIQNAEIPPSKAKGPSSADGCCSPDKPMSPLSIVNYSRPMTPDSSESLTPERAVSPLQIVSVTTGPPVHSQSAEFVEVVGSHTVFRVAKERQSWQLQRTNSSGPSVITTEDNKIHIHLGSPYIQAHSISQPISRYCPNGQIHRNPPIFSGNSSKVDSKITSSITITPTTSPTSRPSHITVSNAYD